ncbi:MAG: hypothetical protein PUD71_08515 [Lachnospiraceae bacterium]|nr:hypothetical protein [Lachnospiraceae bacterium]MDD6858397.1 hypothetical protein [Lachnospiraceae bacterium]
MNKFMKKMTAVIMTFALAVTAVLVSAPNTMVVKAATSPKVYINPYSERVVTYKPGSDATFYSGVISICGCNKKSEIKKLKSDNKNIKVVARDGYISVQYGKKAGKANITCTVRGVKLKTTFTVKKYSNPLKSFKIGTTNFKSKYNKINSYRQTKSFKNQTFTIQTNSGWKIKSVLLTQNGKYKYYYPNSSKFSAKISLTKDYDDIGMIIKNEKTGVSEYISFTNIY